VRIHLLATPPPSSPTTTVSSQGVTGRSREEGSGKKRGRKEERGAESTREE